MLSSLVTLSRTAAVLISAMDIISVRDIYGEMEHRVSDDSFSDILGDIDTFSDSHSESDWSDIGNLDNIQETMIFDWSNEAYMSSLNK